MWSEMSADQKQRFQQVIFPEGIAFADGHIRTDVTCLLFGWFGTPISRKTKVGSDTGIRTRILALRGPRPNP